MGGGRGRERRKSARVCGATHVKVSAVYLLHDLAIPDMPVLPLFTYITFIINVMTIIVAPVSRIRYFVHVYAGLVLRKLRVRSDDTTLTSDAVPWGHRPVAGDGTLWLRNHIVHPFVRSSECVAA